MGAVIRVRGRSTSRDGLERAANGKVIFVCG